MKRLLLASAIALLVVPALAADQDDSKEQASATLKKYVESWMDAAKKHDAGPLEKMLADDYMFTNPFGQVSGKDEMVGAVKDGTFVPESDEFSDVKVRVYGDAAVVTGLVSLKGKWGDTDIGGEYRFTDTFVKKDGKWQQVAGQVTRVGTP